RSRRGNLVTGGEDAVRPDNRVGAYGDLDFPGFNEVYNVGCCIHIHVTGQKLAVCFLLDNRIIEIVKQPLDAYSLIIGIRVNGAEFFCDLHQFPFEKSRSFESEPEYAWHMRGFKGDKEIADISGTNIKWQAQQDPVCIQFYPHGSPVPCRDQDRQYAR